MNLDQVATINSIQDKLELLKIPNLQQFENYSNIELIKVCRMFVISPIYK